MIPQYKNGAASANRTLLLGSSDRCNNHAYSSGTSKNGGSARSRTLLPLRELIYSQSSSPELITTPMDRLGSACPTCAVVSLTTDQIEYGASRGDRTHRSRLNRPISPPGRTETHEYLGSGGTSRTYINWLTASRPTIERLRNSNFSTFQRTNSIAKKTKNPRPFPVWGSDCAFSAKEFRRKPPQTSFAGYY
jgi:hypothetical protein